MSEDTSLTEQPEEAARSDPDWLPYWEIIALALGDVIVLLLFAAIGRTSHAREGGFVGVVNTGMPFVTAWLVVALIGGAYSGKALYPLKRVILRTLLSALISGPLGVGLWAVFNGKLPNWTFFVVATGSITVMMLIWRVGWSRLRHLWWPELP